LIRSAIIRLNNWVTRRRRVRVPPGHLLLLLPHCLQRSRCEQNVVHNVDQCRRCGQCDLAALLKLRDEFGLLCSLASGGRQALAYVRRADVKAVVAVACEKELLDGIRAAFPKPVLAVPNKTPHGPCHDTVVDLQGVREALGEMLAGPSARPS
jgi:uncharacterized protein